MPEPLSRPAFASPAELPAPTGYSHVVSIPPGRLVWTSGQVPLTADGVIAAGLEAQTRLVFENLTRALSAAGAAWHDLVKLTIYLVDVAGVPAVRAVRDQFVNAASPPTSSLVQVAALFHPDVLVEIEAVAWLPA